MRARSAQTSEAAAEIFALEQRALPVRALYEHWERTQWSALALDIHVPSHIGQVASSG